MWNVFIFLVFGQVFFISSVWGYTCRGDSMVEKASRIKLIAFDVDGVLTNGEIAYTANGDEIKTFNVKDGLGLVLASQKGFITALITGRESSIVERRGKELKVHHIYQNTKDKIAALEELASHWRCCVNDFSMTGSFLEDAA